jgi:polar amino acid transport system substrate-binding protein
MQADKLASLGVLIAGIAHEINNPNNYILLNARMLAKVWHDVLPILQAHYETNGDFTLAGIPFTHVHDKIGQLVSGTADGAMRIQRIVHNLRNFVRNDTGDLNQPVDMNQVVAAALVIVDSLISNSTNVFSVEYAPLLPTVKGNAQQLEQVIINLVTNSCQALRNKQEAIHVVTRHDLPSNSVVVQVADGGVGIPPEHTAHIFDLFFTTKQEREGTGLGLPVSHSIITNHGGDVRIESELGKGTTVTISLPLHRRDNLA